MSVDDWWDDLWFCSFEQHVLITCIGEWVKAWFRPRLLMPCISAAHCWTVLTVMWWSWPHTFLSRLWFCLLQKSCSTTLWSRKVKHHQMTGVFFSWYCFLFCFFFFLFFLRNSRLAALCDHEALHIEVSVWVNSIILGQRSSVKQMETQLLSTTVIPTDENVSFGTFQCSRCAFLVLPIIDASQHNIYSCIHIKPFIHTSVQTVSHLRFPFKCS